MTEEPSLTIPMSFILMERAKAVQQMKELNRQKRDNGAKRRRMSDRTWLLFIGNVALLGAIFLMVHIRQTPFRQTPFTFEELYIALLILTLTVILIPTAVYQLIAVKTLSTTDRILEEKIDIMESHCLFISLLLVPETDKDTAALQR